MTEYNTLQEAIDANKVKNAAKKKIATKPQIGKSVGELSPEQVAAKYNNRRRNGKTDRDAANGNKQRNRDRKQARADWQHDNRATSATFPV